MAWILVSNVVDESFRTVQECDRWQASKMWLGFSKACERRLSEKKPTASNAIGAWTGGLEPSLLLSLKKGSPSEWRRAASNLASQFNQTAVRLVIAQSTPGELLTDWQFRFRTMDGIDVELLKQACGTWDHSAIIVNTGNGRISKHLPRLVERYGQPAVQRVKVERWGPDLRPVSFETERASSARPTPAESVLLSRAAETN